VLSAANQQQIHVEVVVIFPLAGVPRSIHERQYAMPMRQFYGDRVRNEGAMPILIGGIGLPTQAG
jgi:hypothetical protein